MPKYSAATAHVYAAAAAQVWRVMHSGGLDSFAGAVKQLSAGRNLILVGHYGAGITPSVQKSVTKVVEKFWSKSVEARFFRVQPRREGAAAGETTMRSRSFLFIALGVCVASAEGSPLLVIPENGLISLNIPLTKSRLGSLSTRTTHPYFISTMQDLLNSLVIPVNLELPYRFYTKGEMLQELGHLDAIKQGTPLTMSCAHPESLRHYGVPPTTHCGYCIPCIIRRAATSSAKVPDGKYFIDIKTTRPMPPSGRARDLRALESLILNRKNEDPRTLVLSQGPLPANQFADYLAVFERGLAEIEAFI